MSLAPPSWLGQAPPFTLVTPTTGSSVATSGNGTTNIYTSVSLPAGTYLVGGNFIVLALTTFTTSDSIYFRITDTGGGLTLYPQTLLTGYSQQGSASATLAATVTGILILNVATTISWQVVCSFTLATGKTAYLSNPFYQRVA
jgi:hypothetical protein